MARYWDDFKVFDAVTEKYLPDIGQGDTMASQIATAVCKLVYKWYNDGDVYDNTVLDGWANDLSSYANWLAEYTGAAGILEQIFTAYSGDDYEDILWQLCTYLLDADEMEKRNMIPAMGSVYRCDGKFRFVEDDEEEWW